MVTIDGGGFPRWGLESGEIFDLNQDRMMVVEVVTRPRLELGRPRELFVGRDNGLQLFPARRYDVSADGQRLVVVQQVGSETKPPGITVVENWLAEFED